MMKKIFCVMTVCGVLLAMMTAGGMDAGSLTMGRIVVQAVISSLLVLCGAEGTRALER